MHLRQEDLQGLHYAWTNDGKVLYSGGPTRRAFDRFNGDQVLMLINYCGSLFEQFTVEEGRMIEQRIINELPMEAKSEISVFNWIRESILSLN